MTKAVSLSEAPTVDEVLAALERVVVSEPLRSSPQLAAFLNFVVHSVLQGKSDRIKGYTIGVEVLRRDTKFDPQLDPIVRVEASRLRRALERYYAGIGASDPIIIALPRGSYVPTFTRRSEVLEDPDVPETPVPQSRWSLWASGALVLALAAAGAAWVFVLDRRAPSVPPAPAVEARRAPQTNGMPTLLVDRFEIAGRPSERAPSAGILLEKIRNAMSRFDTINIVTRDPQPTPRADYQLRGLIEYSDGGATSIRLNLVDVSEGKIVWARSFDRLPLTGDRSAIENTVAGTVAVALVQPFGVIRARERAKQLVSNEGDPRYRCILLASDAFRSADPAQYAQSRACLEAMIAQHPDFAEGFAYLAVVNNREWTYGFGKAADDPNALDAALKLARRGVELRPDDARMWHILASILTSRGDIMSGVAAIEKAAALNPNDRIIAVDLGGRLVTVGQVDRGMKILEAIPKDDVVRPSWQHFYLFLGHYMRGNLAAATHEADEMTSDSYVYGLFARALMAAKNGDMAKARATWSKLVALRSAWQSNPRAELAKFIPAPAILDRLTQDLAATGLMAAN